ncbi:MAG: trimethylamine methyltransferase family protein [Anaerolineae bacterium]
MLSTLTDRDVEVLAEAVCTILEKVGFYVENAEILSAYEMMGAHVDYTAQVARFPSAVTLRFVESVRREPKEDWQHQLGGANAETMYSGFHPYHHSGVFKRPELPYMFHNTSTYYLDDETGERRLGNKRDFVELIKLGDGLHPDKGMGHALLLAADAQPEVEPLEAALVLLEYAHFPRGVYVHDVRQIPYLQEIEAVFGIEDPYWHWLANVGCSTPLKLEKAVADRYVYMLKSGLYPAKVYGMPVAGVNMPITVAGALAIQVAEYVALWMAARSLQPKKVPLVGMCLSGTMDPRGGDVSYGAFDAAIIRLATCDLVRKWLGVQMAPGPGEWLPTKTPGLYAVLEKAYFALLAGAFTGYHPELGCGHVDSGLTISRVQLLLEREFWSALQFLERPVVDRDTLGLDTILRVGFGLHENYVSSEHTIAHMRIASWMPELLTRSGWSPEADADAKARALKRAEEIAARYTKPKGRESQLARARAVLERAKKDLCA